MEKQDEPRPLQRQAIKVTGVSVVISSLANKIPDPVIKDWILTFSPIAGYLVNIFLNILNGYITYRYSRWVMNGNIRDLRKRQKEPTCGLREKKDIDDEIKSINKAIRKKRISDLIIKF